LRSGKAISAGRRISPNGLGFGKFVTRSQLEHTTLLATRSPPAILARGDLAMFHWDATGVLSDRKVPGLVIGGDIDIVTKLEASRTIAAESDLATLEVVEGVNHMGPIERADLYNRMIGDFALRVQPSASTDRPSAAQRVDPDLRPDPEHGVAAPPLH
jgi:pimeloyl-ACP methyl ester carboxylesterase